jgi:hypothetical protein
MGKERKFKNTSILNLNRKVIIIDHECYKYILKGLTHKNSSLVKKK